MANETNRPSYYRRGNIEVWDFIRDQGLSFHLGNAIKYICRAGYKTSEPIRDLNKAIHYLENERDFILSNSSSGVQESLRVPPNESDPWESVQSDTSDEANQRGRYRIVRGYLPTDQWVRW